MERMNEVVELANRDEMAERVVENEHYWRNNEHRMEHGKKTELHGSQKSGAKAEIVVDGHTDVGQEKDSPKN